MTTTEELFKAAQECDLAAVQRMIEANPELIHARDEADSSLCLLHVAATFNCKDVVAWLLGKGLDVDVRDGKGNTPLMMAASAPIGDFEGTMEFLLRCGADVNAVNEAGNTALGMAEFLLKECPHLVPARWIAAIKLLREHGAKEQ